MCIRDRLVTVWFVIYKDLWPWPWSCWHSSPNRLFLVWQGCLRRRSSQRLVQVVVWVEVLKEKVDFKKSQVPEDLQTFPGQDVSDLPLLVWSKSWPKVQTMTFCQLSTWLKQVVIHSLSGTLTTKPHQETWNLKEDFVPFCVDFSFNSGYWGKNICLLYDEYFSAVSLNKS